MRRATFVIMSAALPLGSARATSSSAPAPPCSGSPAVTHRRRSGGGALPPPHSAPKAAAGSPTLACLVGAPTASATSQSGAGTSAPILDDQGGLRFGPRASPAVPRLCRLVVAGLILMGVGCAGVSAEQKRQAEAHGKLGYAFMEDGLYQQAFAEFHRAKEANPRDPTIHYALGHLSARQEQWLEASRAFEVAVKLDPAYSDGHNYLGVTYHRLGRTEDAIRQFRKALENPVWTTPHLAHHGLGLILLGMNRLDEAVEEFRSALRTQPDYRAARYQLAEVYKGQGRLREAIEEYKEVVRLAPEREEAHYALAEAYRQAGEHRLAAVEFRRVLDLSPDSEFAKKARAALETIR